MCPRGTFCLGGAGIGHRCTGLQRVPGTSAASSTPAAANTAASKHSFATAARAAVQGAAAVPAAARQLRPAPIYTCLQGIPYHPVPRCLMPAGCVLSRLHRGLRPRLLCELRHSLRGLHLHLLRLFNPLLQECQLLLHLPLLQQQRRVHWLGCLHMQVVLSKCAKCACVCSAGGRRMGF